MVVQEEVRKGPWTEHEDVQLVFYVNLFGDRRWDFVAKVSGLKRTGKSCRLRWVNYLHPGLKRGKMTPQEERLVLELHSKWGNRWSRIARKLPGRTDNEIKNYWRTHTRKEAQARKRVTSQESSLSNSSSSSSNSHVDSIPVTETKERSFYDTGGVEMFAAKGNKTDQGQEGEIEKGYSMDDIWRDIEKSENNAIKPIYDGHCQTMASPLWDNCPDSLWTMMDQDEEEISKMFLPINELFNSFCNQENTFFPDS